MNRKNELLARVYVVMTAFVLFTVLVFIKVIDINVVEGDLWRSKLKQNIKWIEVAGDRGSIFSDDGSLLAASQPFFEIRFDLLTIKEDEVFAKDVDSLAYYISRDLRPEKTPYEWKKELLKARKGGQNKSMPGARYYLVAKAVDYNQLLQIRKYPIFRKGRFGGGLIEVQKSKRVKPFNQMASRTIGVDRKNAEKIGLEGYFDDYLRGQQVERLYKRLPNKIWIPVVEEDNRLLSKGADLVTTINVGINDVVHQAVLRKLHESRAEAGVGIVMDVETGAVKAMTSLSIGKNGAYAEHFNLAMGWKGKYNPGSTFKLATVLAMLEDGHANNETLVDLERGVKVFGDRKMFDSEPHDLRWVDLEKAFVISSNVGMAKLANEYYNQNLEGRKQFVKRLKSFGLNDKTNITIVGESEPVIKDPVLNKKDWSGISIPWMAHGYELELTPLQLLTFYNTIANGGKLIKPHLVEEVIKDGEVIKKYGSQSEETRIASEYNILKVQKMLKKVVEEGTAKRLKNNRADIAGKTGTSRINFNAKEGEIKLYNASFAGYFPAKNPKYSCIVVMYGVSGINNIYGSQSAAPVFGEIAERIMSFENESLDDNLSNTSYASGNFPKRFKGYGRDVKEVLDFSSVPYQKDEGKSWVELENSGGQMQIGELKISRKTVPDVRGMGIRDAVYILENLGLTVKINGVGRVNTQSIRPGTKNVKQEIEIFLK